MNQQNLIGSIKILKIFALLIGAVGASYLGFSFFGRSRQIQEFQQANQLLEQQQYERAITAYDRLLAGKSEGDRYLLVNRGYAFGGVERYEQMLQSCTKATSLAPEFDIAWNCQGEALYYLKKYSDALNAFERASAINSSEATFWLNKAIVLSELEQYQGAITASDRAIALEDRAKLENRAVAWHQKGQNLLKLGEYRQSIIAFEESLSLADRLSPRQGKGIALYELGEYDLAIATFQNILQSDRLTKKQQSTALLYLGVSLCQAEKITAAKKVFDRALPLITDPASVAIATKKCGIR